MAVSKSQLNRLFTSIPVAEIAELKTLNSKKNTIYVNQRQTRDKLETNSKTTRDKLETK
jgi:hypothetical protein